MAKKLIKIVEPIPGTTDLKPPELEATYEVESSGDEDHERVKMDYIEKNFANEMRKVFKAQIKGFAVPLASIQKEIDAMRAKYEAATNSTDPFVCLEQITQSVALKKSMDDKIKEYGEYLKGAVKNTVEQQILIHAGKIEKEAEAAAKKQIKKDVKWKKFRHVAGIVVKGILVVGGAAAAIALSVVTMGAFIPVIAGLKVAFVAFGGLVALGKTGKDIKARFDLEKASMANLEKDLAEINIHLGNVQSKSKGLPKHLDDASRLGTERQGLIREARMKIDQISSKLNEASAALQKMSELKSMKVKQAQIKKLTEARDAAVKALEGLQARDKQMADLFAKARAVVGQLEKLPVGESQSLKDSVARLSNVQIFISEADNVSNLGTVAAMLA